MKKIVSLIWSFVWGLGLVWGVVLLFDKVSLVSADPNVLYVAPGGLCGGAAPCYSSVQHAVDAASDGDQIKIAVGHYSSVELCSGMSQIVYISKTITIGGGYTVTDWSHIESASTILDAQSQGRVAYVTGSVTVTLENLVLTGGNATAAGGSDVGGGIYVNGANLSVVQSIISNNVAGSGGAIHAVGASVTVQTSQVMSNAGGLGFSQCQVMLVGNHIYSNTHGGIVLGSGTIAILDANDICENTSESYSAGIFIDHSVVTITHNIISENVSQLDGGGLMIFQSVATVEGNQIFSNTAQGIGGGLMSFESIITLTANIITANQAFQDGGGVFLSTSDATLINNVIAQNQAVLGNAVFVLNSSPVYMVHNTIAQNSGGSGQGIYILGNPVNPSTVTLTNTIMVSQSVGIDNFNGTVNVNGVLWYGNGANYTGAVTASNEITGSPDFVSSTTGNYQLGKSSAAIDNGVDAGIMTDISGRQRDAHPDLGAYEARLVDVSLTKTVSPVAALPGEPITFTLTFSNGGLITATHIIITDQISAFFSITSVLSYGIAVTDTGYISPYVWTAQDLSPGASGLITIVGQLASPLADGVYTNTASVTADDDAWVENNTAIITVAVTNTEYWIYLPLVVKHTY